MCDISLLLWNRLISFLFLHLSCLSLSPLSPLCFLRRLRPELPFGEQYMLITVASISISGRSDLMLMWATRSRNAVFVRFVCFQKPCCVAVESNINVIHFMESIKVHRVFDSVFINANCETQCWISRLIHCGRGLTRMHIWSPSSLQSASVFVIVTFSWVCIKINVGKTNSDCYSKKSCCTETFFISSVTCVFCWLR